MKRMYCNLAVLMAQKGPKVSQKQVAEETGLSTTTVNKLYHSRFDRIDTDTVEKLCSYFSCTVGQLFVLKEDIGEGI